MIHHVSSMRHPSIRQGIGTRRFIAHGSLRTLIVAFLSFLLAGIGLSAVAAPALADPPENPETGSVSVSGAIAQDTSPPLRDLLSSPDAPDGAAAARRTTPGSLVAGSKPPANPSSAVAVQGIADNPPMPPTSQNFPGITNRNGYLPPDTNGDVGPNHYVQIVNSSFAVFDKSGAVLYGPVNNNTVWGGFGGECQLRNDGDPIVQYDGVADRWLISQFAVWGAEKFECVAVSTTGDPLGQYQRYAFSYGVDFPDYPQIGVWPDGYYVTYNMYEDVTAEFQGAKTCVLERRAMLIGAPATQQCFLRPEAESLLPSDVDGPTPPPIGAPNYVMSKSPEDDSSLLMYRFAVDWNTPANTTFTGPITIPVTPYTSACTAISSLECVPQPDTSALLDSLGDRAMYRLAYRNFGDHESLVFNFTVAMDGNPAYTAQTGVQWYEIRSPGAPVPMVYQEGTVASDVAGEFRWMGSIAMDRQGNIGLGYSSSSTTKYPSINYLGRLAGDPLGTMPYAEGTIQDGGGSQTFNPARWGDYSAMQVDPLDDCTFWYTNQYLKVTSPANWSTQIASFTFPGCTGSTTVPGAPQSAVATPALGQAQVKWQPPSSDGGLPINGYTVTASPGGATCTTVVGVQNDPLTCTIAGLDRTTAYTFTVLAHNALGASPATDAGPVTPGAGIVPVTPVRIADTRADQPVAFPVQKQPVAAGGTLVVPVAGSFGVPADAAGVALNVTAVAPDGSGFLTVYPCGITVPLASNLNFTAKQVVPNAVLTGPGTDGAVCVYASAATDVVVDLDGWLPPGAGFTATTPVRVADTRAPSVFPPIPAGGTLQVPVAGRFGVPADAAALALNVTVVGPAAPGFLTVYPCGSARPNASNVNYVTGQIVPNAVMSQVGADGAICVFSQQATNVIIDLDGWFAPWPGFTALDPVRVADTRVGQPVAFPNPKQRLPAGGTLTVPVAGQFGVPTTVGAVSMNVTVTGPSASGFLTVYPCGQARPNASNLNYTSGQTVPNAVVSGVGAGGSVCVFSQQATDIIVDLNGWAPGN